MRLKKIILRKAKRFLVAVLGSKTDEAYWRFRHIVDKEWVKGYMPYEAVHPYRKLLMEKIAGYFPFESILEFGCSAGPNLYGLAKKFNEVKIYGIDISKKAIEEGRKYFEKENIKNVHLKTGGIEAIKTINDKSIDIFFTNKVLIYFDNHKIEEAIREILRVTKKAIIILELHHYLEDSIYKDNWIHNYKLLFKKFIPEEKIKISKIPENIQKGNWAEYGHIIEVIL